VNKPDPEFDAYLASGMMRGVDDRFDDEQETIARAAATNAENDLLDPGTVGCQGVHEEPCGHSDCYVLDERRRAGEQTYVYAQSLAVAGALATNGQAATEEDTFRPTARTADVIPSVFGVEGDAPADSFTLGSSPPDPSCLGCNFARAVAEQAAARAKVDEVARAAFGDDYRAVILSKYHVDNLLSLLALIYCGVERGPHVLATGDWAGEIYWMLAPEGAKFETPGDWQTPGLCRPNALPEEMLARLLAWARAREQEGSPAR
jgi:hypothetical protein